MEFTRRTYKKAMTRALKARDRAERDWTRVDSPLTWAVFQSTNRICHLLADRYEYEESKRSRF